MCECSISFGGRRIVWLLFAAFLQATIFEATICFAGEKDMHGEWTVRLEVPGGELPFTLDVEELTDGSILGTLSNGTERLKVDTQTTADSLIVDFPHYDSRLELKPVAGATDQLQGAWTKTRGEGNKAVVQANATRKPLVFTGDGESFAGRWQIKFADSDEPAIGIFTLGDHPSEVRGTILTTTGDYRFLSGGVIDGRLTLSCFDGAHAFLFHLEKSTKPSSEVQRVVKRGSAPIGLGLQGTFYSGDWYQTSMTAVQDDGAVLPDGFTAATLNESVALGDLEFPDAQGSLKSLADPELLGKVTVIELFGSWCPNCHDEAILLKALHQQYREKGLKVVGLAFELTADPERSWQQLDRYQARYGVDYPLLLAGTSDKAAASKVFPIIDRVRSFPTTLFVDQTGKVRAVYSGFSGPATGDEHARLVERFRKTIEKLLAE